MDFQAGERVLHQGLVRSAKLWHLGDHTLALPLREAKTVGALGSRLYDMVYIYIYKQSSPIFQFFLSLYTFVDCASLYLCSLFGRLVVAAGRVFS